MNEQPLISVIVPIYNAERFLPRCIDSLLLQTYGNLELILVDDGSPDGCPRMIDEYAARDMRVTALHRANEGVSAARNAGALAARGKYIAFVDADDRPSVGMLACLLHAMDAVNADISVCGMRKVPPDVPPLPARTGKVVSLTAEQALSTMLYQKLFYTSPWAKLVKAEIVRAHPFPPQMRYEDMATVYRWLADADTVAFDATQQYDYVQHAESFMARAFTPERFTQLFVSDEVVRFIEAEYPAALPAARARRFAAYCQVLLQTPVGTDAYAGKRREMLACMRADAPLVLRDRSCRAKDRVAAAVFCSAGERGLRLLWRLARRGGI